MNDFNVLMKLLIKRGYPNKEFISTCDLIGYDYYGFLEGLVHNFGEDKASEFINKTLNKLEAFGKGIKIDLGGEEYVYLQIIDFAFGLEEETDRLYIDFGWGDSRIQLNGGKYITLKDLDDEDDFSDEDRDNIYDWIKERAGDQIFSVTGFLLEWGI